MTIFRVSTKKQERAKDYADQKSHVDSYIKEKEFDVVESRQFAETASDHTRRKNFQEAIDTIRASHLSDRPIHHLIFSYQSRSTRNKASEQELESLVELGVELHFARDRRVLNKNSDFTQFMIWYMENFRNSQYSQELKMNVVDGICKSMERGMYPSGRPIYGYLSVGRKENRHFVFDGKKADYMLEAFRMMATGYYQNTSYIKLKKDLDNKFPELKNTPKAKKLGEMLRNPFYSGDFIYADEFHKGDPSVHPPLVNKILWNQVQEVLLGKRKTRSGKKELPYLQILKCSGRILDESGNLTDQVCGCAVTGEEKRKVLKNGTVRTRYYYHCSNTTSRCSQRDLSYMKKLRGKLNYQQEEIEKLFEPIFDSLCITSERAQELTKLLWDEQFQDEKTTEGISKDLKLRLIQIQAKLDQAYEDKLMGDLSSEMWIKLRREWEAEKEDIEVRLTGLGTNNSDDVQKAVELIELVQHIGIIYKSAKPEVKRRMLEMISSNLRLGDASIEYEIKKPFDFLRQTAFYKNWYSQGDSNPCSRREKAVS